MMIRNKTSSGHSTPKLPTKKFYKQLTRECYHKEYLMEMQKVVGEKVTSEQTSKQNKLHSLLDHACFIRNSIH